MMDYFESIYQESLSVYKERNITTTKKGVFALMKKTEDEARERYVKLNEPKTCSIETYIKSCIRYAVDYDQASRPSNNLPGISFYALKAYFDVVPVDTSETIDRTIYNSKRADRKKLWTSFHLPVNNVDKLFKSVCEEKIVFAKKRGFKSIVDLLLDHKQIPIEKYQRFLKKFDETAEFCNKQLPETSTLPSWFYSEFNVPCLLCEMKDFPFNSFEAEKEELVTELELRKKISPEIYNSFFCEALVLFWKIMFLIEMYSEPKDNASILSAQIFNRCFKDAHQKRNRLYVLDEKNVMQP